MGIKEIFVPDIGDFKEVEVVEILVKPGDTVAKEASLVSLESDKATMEIPSPVAGVVKELRIKIGDKVAEGSLLLIMEASEAAAPVAAPASAPAAAPAVPVAVAPAAASAPVVAFAPVAPAPAPVEAPAGNSGAISDASPSHASPSVRKFSRELGVDLARVKGSGPKNRILVTDVQAFVKGALAGGAVSGSASGVGGLSVLPWPKVDFAKFGPTERVPLSRIKKISGAGLTDAVINGAWRNQKITYDPIASSLRKSADDAFALGYLGEKKPDLSGIYALEPLNKVLTELNLKTVQQ